MIQIKTVTYYICDTDAERPVDISPNSIIYSIESTAYYKRVAGAFAQCSESGLLLSEAGGAAAPSQSTVSTNTTLSITGIAQTVFGNLSSNITTTLPTAVGNTGYLFELKRIDSSSFVWTIDANTSQTIDGSLTITIEDQDSVILRSNGTNWVIL